VTTLAVFRLADNWFGVDLNRIERAVPADYLNRFLPGSDLSEEGLVVGTVGIHDRLVSVLDLKAVLGVGCSRVQPHSTILVIADGASGCELGLLTDEFVDVFFVPQGQIYQYPEPKTSPGAALAAVISGECICGNRVITLVEPEGIIRALNHADRVQALAS
jgi:chemotaxis signal transduction protein